MLGLDGLEAAGGKVDRLVPADLAPGIADLVAHHRRELPVLVRGIAPGEAAFDAGVALVGAAVLVRHHADHLITVQLGLEGAADAAIGAGGEYGFGRRAVGDHGFLDQRCCRASLHTGATRNAFGIEEAFVHAGRDMRGESATVDGQCEGALHFLASAHATRANDALGRFELEIGIGKIFGGRAQFVMMVLAVHAVAHITQARNAGHVLQLAITIGAAGEAVERMVGDVEFHDALADFLQAVSLCAHLETCRNRRGAGRWRALAAIDLDQTQTAGAECVQSVGGAEFGDFDPRIHRCVHDRRTLWHRHRAAIDFQCHHYFGELLGRAVVGFLEEGHLAAPMGSDPLSEGI